MRGKEKERHGKYEKDRKIKRKTGREEDGKKGGKIGKERKRKSER